MNQTDAVKAAISAAGYTQKTFAALLGSSMSNLNAKLNGRASFTMDEAERVCALLGRTSAAEKAALFFGKASQK